MLRDHVKAACATAETRNEDCRVRHATVSPAVKICEAARPRVTDTRIRQRARSEVKDLEPERVSRDQQLDANNAQLMPKLPNTRRRKRTFGSRSNVDKLRHSANDLAYV